MGELDRYEPLPDEGGLKRLEVANAVMEFVIGIVSVMVETTVETAGNEEMDGDSEIPAVEAVASLRLIEGSAELIRLTEDADAGIRELELDSLGADEVVETEIESEEDS